MSAAKLPDPEKLKAHKAELQDLHARAAHTLAPMVAALDAHRVLREQHAAIRSGAHGADAVEQFLSAHVYAHYSPMVNDGEDGADCVLSDLARLAARTAGELGADLDRVSTRSLSL